MKINNFLFLLLGLIIFPCKLLADHQHFTFSMPFSGDKGKHYEIQLTFLNQQVKKYLVPNDCNQILNEVSFGTPKPVGLIDKKLWFKAINDCKYVAMLHLHEDKAPVQDFVSNYDFFNARLADLPFASQCKAIDDKEFAEQCNNREPGKLTIASYFPFLEFMVESNDIETEECRFTNGAFRGMLIRTEEGIRCQSNRRARGLRLISVDISDLNNDGYADALLRIVPLGRGVSRFPILLPLTRLQENGPFSICEGLTMDYMNKQ